MKRLHLFEAVGLVDERLVEEAADAKRTAQPWSKWLAAAACMALALSLGTAAAGTLLRGCGSEKSTGATADMAAPAAESMPAPAAEAVSEELSPKMEDHEGVAGSVAQQAADDEPEVAAGLETAPAEPEEPLPEPAAAPPGFDGISNGDEMGGVLQKALELYAADGEIVITPRETKEDGESGIRLAQYWVENQSGAERTEVLHFTMDTGEEGMEGWNLEIRIDGETVPFDAYEATACPTVDGAVPEPEKRSYLIEFAAVLPAREMVEVEIQY